MEDIPPSYDNINPDILDLLPPYLSTASLVNLCLVSKAYYASFIPHLWGSPASHFVHLPNESARTVNGIKSNLQMTGSHHDMVYVALTRFKRILRRARLSTRLLCHTFHLPPALSEIYGGPNTTWLRDVLDWLPALQSLCVSGLPFFDHDSLVAVDRTRNLSVPSDPNQADFKRYPLKLLLAAKEPNLTWAGLALLIPHLPDLVYLDLSYTSPARDVNVLASLESLIHLQVLKLRGVGLRDNEAEVLANAIRLRVRLLDVAENNLTDMAVRSLLQACVWLPSTPSTGRNLPTDQYSRRHLESWPVGIPPPPDALSLDTIRTVDLDDALLNQLTNPLTGRLAFEDLPHSGITHLYISGNPGVTIESIRSILNLGRLHVLDAGNIAAMTAMDIQVLEASRRSKSIREVSRTKSINGNSKANKGFLHRRRSPPSSVHSNDTGFTQDDISDEDNTDMLRLPGAEKLVPVLYENASKNLTHIRIDHAVVTAVLDVARELKEKEKVIASKHELPGSMILSAELSGEDRRVYEVIASKTFATEMPPDNAIFEMDGTPAAPRAELPGDPIHFAISPPVGDAPQQDGIATIMSPIRGEGAMAPEVVPEYEARSVEVKDEVVLDATGSVVKQRPHSESDASLISEISSPISAVQPEMPAPLRIRKAAPPPTAHRPVSSSANIRQILDLTELRPRAPVTKLYPSHLPHLRTLVLTNLPAKVPSSQPSIIDNLKAFITGCAAESRLSLLKAITNYSLPPGKARQDAERQHARTLFALQAIVLEVNPEDSVAQERGWKHTRQRLNISKSSTGDMDSESLWSAAENDFSFFGEAGEEAAECGIYDHDPEKYFPTASLEEKIVVPTDEQSFSSETFSPNVYSPRYISPMNGNHFASVLSPVTPLARNGTLVQSPRNLPLGRNRRPSNESRTVPRGLVSETSGGQNGYANGSYIAEMPSARPQTPAGSYTATQSFFSSQDRRPSTPLTPAPSSAQTIRPSTRSGPTSAPAPVQAPQEVMLDVVAELAAWRRERKAAYEEESRRQQRLQRNSAASRVAEMEVYVQGHWAGEIKVVRNPVKSLGNANKGRHERTGNVDVYGNYFEGGYLYP